MYHCHNDHLGTPNELTNQDGEVVWLADYEAYGNTAKVVWLEEQLESVQVTADEIQPIRFQGQFIDQETGLHYNRFRYYDPDLGMFISRDPIGLMGGNNVFQYAPNPIGWVDPFGLEKCLLSKADKDKLGPAPHGMYKPHYHHIVRENAPSTWKAENRKLITEAQDIIKKHGIDLNRDIRNFTWVPNGRGTHTVSSARHVHETLVKANKNGKKAVERALKELGDWFSAK